jgi:hypothetical protein
MFLKSEGDFVVNVRRADGRGRENHQQALTVVQGVLDRLRPALTRRNVQLIQPHVCPGSFQVCGQPKGEFGIVTAVAEKSCLCLCCQAELPGQKTDGKDIVAEAEGIAFPFSVSFVIAGKVNYTFLDRILSSSAKFSYTLGRNATGMRNFGSHVDRLANVSLASRGTTKNDLRLNIKLPKYGAYVDISDLLDLTESTTVAHQADRSVAT